MGLPLPSPELGAELSGHGTGIPSLCRAASIQTRALSCADMKACQENRSLTCSTPVQSGRSFSNYPNTGVQFSMSENKRSIIFIFPVKPRGAALCSLVKGSV